MSEHCTCFESEFWVEPDLVDCPTVYDAECKQIATCCNRQLAEFIAEKLNSLTERELVAVSGCRAEDLGMHLKDPRR